MLLSGGLGACVLWGVVSQAAAHASVGGSDPQFSREQVRRIVLADIANAELRTGRVLTRARVTNISGDGATWQVDFRGTAASCGGWWCNLDSAGRYSFRNDALRGTTFSKPPPGNEIPPYQAMTRRRSAVPRAQGQAKAKALAYLRDNALALRGVVSGNRACHLGQAPAARRTPRHRYRQAGRAQGGRADMGHESHRSARQLSRFLPQRHELRPLLRRHARLPGHPGRLRPSHRRCPGRADHPGPTEQALACVFGEPTRALGLQTLTTTGSQSGARRQNARHSTESVIHSQKSRYSAVSAS